jgi:hypothetical protein
MFGRQHFDESLNRLGETRFAKNVEANLGRGVFSLRGAH